MKGEQLSYRWGLICMSSFQESGLIKPTVRETDRPTGRQRHTYTHKHYLRLV